MRLRDALRKARIEAADRTGVVVDLRDAEVARLEILNEALDPLFGQIPDKVDLFDRGISQGDTPRLWIDVVAHVVMGRDKRIYRFVQDTRFGRIVIAESHDVAAMVDAVTDYVARRLIEREHALVATPVAPPAVRREAAPQPVLDLRAGIPARRAGAVRPRAVRELARSSSGCFGLDAATTGAPCAIPRSRAWRRPAPASRRATAAARFPAPASRNSCR